MANNGVKQSLLPSFFFFSFAAEQIPEDILHVSVVPEDMRASSCLSRQATGAAGSPVVCQRAQ